MTTDSTTPTLMTVRKVAASIPGRDGLKPIHPSAVVRWILSGVPARSGERVKLIATRMGGRWLIRPTDLMAFFEALSSVTPSANQQPKKRRNEAQRKRDSEAAARELIRRGA